MKREMNSRARRPTTQKVVQGDAGASGQKPHAPIILERPPEFASSFFMVR